MAWALGVKAHLYHEITSIPPDKQSGYNASNGSALAVVAGMPDGA